MQQIERGLTEEKEASAQALAKEVARATLAEIQGMLDRDMDILEKKLPGKPEQAVESALDMKYMRERQLSFSCMKLFQVVGTFFLLLCSLLLWVSLSALERKGRQYAEEFMKTKCCLVPVEDDMQALGTSEFLKFLEPMRGVAGTVCLRVTFIIKT